MCVCVSKQTVRKFHQNPHQLRLLLINTCTQTVLSHIHTDLKASFRCQIMTYQLLLADTKSMCVWKHVGVFLREAFETQTKRQSALMSRITVDHTPKTCKQVQFTKCYCKRKERESVCVFACVCVFVPVLFQTLNYFNTKTRLLR